MGTKATEASPELWQPHWRQLTTMDGVEENEPCTAFEVEYASGITIGSDDVTIECQEKNQGNNCATRACIIEGNFVLSVFAAFFSNVEFDPDQKHIEEGGLF